MRKEAGKVIGYIYTAKNKKTETYIATNKEIEDITKPLNITTDGEYEIQIRVKDEAGNMSNTNTINVYKDEVKPEIGTATISDITTDGFTIQAGAKDETSGIAKYVCMIGETEKGSTTNAGGLIKVTGLSALTTYSNVYIRAYDHAGNYNDTLPVSATTIEDLKPPTIRILDNNTWCNTSKTAEIDGKSGYYIMYTTNGSDPSSTSGTKLTGTGTKSITISTEKGVVKAIYVSNTDANRKSDVGVSDTVKIDKTAPKVTNIRFPSGATRNTHSTAVQFTVTDNDAGFDVNYLFASPSSSSYGSTPPTYGTSASGWNKTSSSTYSVTYTVYWDSFYKLSPTKGHMYFKVKDKVGNVSNSYDFYSEPTDINTSMSTPTGKYLGSRWLNSSDNDYRKYNYYASGPSYALYGLLLQTRESESTPYRWKWVMVSDDTSYPRYKYSIYNWQTGAEGGLLSDTGYTNITVNYLGKNWLCSTRKWGSYYWDFPNGNSIIKMGNDWVDADTEMIIKHLLDIYFSS